MHSIPVVERGGRRGTNTRVGLAAVLKPTFWGEKGESLSSWGDAWLNHDTIWGLGHSVSVTGVIPHAAPKHRSSVN